MIENSLAQLMANVASLSNTMFPELSAEVRAYLDALDAADERDGDRLTKRALDARQKLRNPYFQSTHAAKAASVARKKRDKAVPLANAAIIDALQKTVVAIQLERQVEELSHTDDPVEPSRKQPMGWNDQALQQFAEQMNERGVPPGAFGRLRENEQDLIAKIVRYSVQDPDGIDLGNPVYRLARAGELSAMRDNATDDETRLMAEIDEFRLQPDWFKMRADLERRLGRPVDLLPCFAASMERIARGTENLSSVEAQNLSMARGRVFDQQGKQLAALLQLAPEDAPKVSVILSCLREGIGWYDEHYTVRLAMRSLESIVKDIEAHDCPPEDWISLVLQDLQKFESSIADKLTRPQQFYALLSHVIAGSGELHKYYAERTASASFDTLDAPEPKPAPTFAELHPEFADCFDTQADEDDAHLATVSDPSPTDWAAAHQADAISTETLVNAPVGDGTRAVDCAQPGNALVLWRDPNTVEPEPQMPTAQRAQFNNNLPPIRPSRQEDFE